MSKIITPNTANPLEMRRCDVCGRKFNIVQMIALPNELAQPEINEVHKDCFEKAAREFYQPMRDIMMRMQGEAAWK